MKPIAPNDSISVMSILKNWYQVLNASLGFGTPASFDNLGVPLTYNQDNTNGCMVRVGSSTSSIAVKWPASATNVNIPHSLNRQPIGYIVFRKSGPCDIYSGTDPWTTTTISLQTTDATQDTHIYIF